LFERNPLKTTATDLKRKNNYSPFVSFNYILNRYKNIIKVLITVNCLLLTAHSFSQGTQEKFGQNRVQYKKFLWSFFESKHFVTYFYLGGQETGRYAVQYAEKVLPEIETMFDYKLAKRTEILIYNDLSDLNQTNIGYGQESFNVGGQVRFIKNKMFIYFNGNHQDLERQIRQGLAQVILAHMMFGGSFTEVLQNAVMMNMPAWYITGLTSYVGKSWDAEKDDRLKDGILTGKFKKSNRLRGEDATFFGHAFWYYVEEKYGKSTVTNLIYLTRSSRSLDNSFTFVLGAGVKTILPEMYQFYYQRFAEEKENKQIPDVSNIAKVRIRSDRHYSQLRMNDDANKISYVSNNMGAWKVHLKNIETGKRKRILRGGFKTNTLVTDYQYPLTAWSPDNKTLAVIYERRDKTRMVLHDTEKKRKKKERSFITKFQQIHDFSFTDNPKTLLMSAVNRGHSDVYTYYIPSTTVQQITTDHYDDLDVSFFKSETHRGIMFSSNRISDTLETKMLDSTTHSKNFDIYFYDLDKNNKVLTKLTNSSFNAETNPQQYNEKYFSYISEENGIRNRYLGYFKNILARYDTVVFFRDSIVTNPTWNLDSLKNTTDNRIDSSKVLSIYKDVGEIFPHTDYVSNIVEEDISMKTGKTAQMFLLDYRPKFFIEPLPAEINEFLPELKKTDYGKFNGKLIEQEQKKIKAETAQAVKLKLIQSGEAEEDTVEEVDEPVLFFQSEYNTTPEINVRYVRNKFAVEENEEKAEPLFRFNKVRPYQLRFATDYLSTQFFDNSLMVTRYQKFTPGYPTFNNPPSASAMIKLGVVNLFEDYRIVGGFRMPLNFKDSEYFLAYETLKKRLDKRVMYYRRTQGTTYADSSGIPFFGISPYVAPSRAIESKQITNYAELQLNYAIDVLRSIRNTIAYRNERYVFLSTDQISSSIPIYAENWLFYRGEYVFDRTLKLGMNIQEGLKFKFFGEIHKDFTMKDKTIGDNINIKLPSFSKNYMGVYGFDVRYYLKLHKEIIWANRFAYGGSFGTQKLIYYLGGVDSWIMPKFNNDIPVNNNNNYAFQTIVTNMRGFSQNIRNGNNYAVLNSEIRVPIFSYLINSPIRSEFIKNFQIVGFTDIGTAWEGTNPYDKDNPLFTETIGKPPVTVKVKYYRNPFVTGYGFGLRSVLLGYFIRFDLGWGNDSGRVGKPIPYFSLTTDF
jgi:hypothetical protein